MQFSFEHDAGIRREFCIGIRGKLQSSNKLAEAGDY